MSITKNVPAPTSYNRLHESKTIFGIHDRLMFVWCIHIAVGGFTLIFMREAGLHNPIFYLLVIILFIISVFIIARDVKTLDRNCLHILLIFRILRKKNNTIKYIEPLDDLKKIISIETVEDSGLITYPDGTSGVIILYDPPRTAAHERDNQSTRIKNIINSLYGGFSFQFISTSVIDYKNPLLESTSEAMKKSDNPIEITKHLFSLYEEAKNKKEDIDVEFSLIVYIPKTKTISEAEQLRSAFIPSILKSMQRAGIFSRELVDRNEVIRNMREQLC
ncbi:MAG: hypothetical protein ACT6FG_00415 [Methanosarcinaceae archaeon]